MNKGKSISSEIIIDKYRSFYFAAATNDFNPIHFDEQAAKDTGCLLFQHRSSLMSQLKSVSKQKRFTLVGILSISMIKQEAYQYKILLRSHLIGNFQIKIL